MKIGMITDSLPDADFDTMLAVAARLVHRRPAAAVGYDGVLSIEHEDPAMSAVEGVEKSVAPLGRVIGNRPLRSPAIH
jgi:sugar phosphate isomerase/epimerase